VREVAAASQETSKAAESLAALVEQLQAEAEHVRETAAVLDGSVAELVRVGRAFRPLDEEQPGSPAVIPARAAQPAGLPR